MQSQLYDPVQMYAVNPLSFYSFQQLTKQNGIQLNNQQFVKYQNGMGFDLKYRNTGLQFISQWKSKYFPQNIINQYLKAPYKLQYVQEIPSDSILETYKRSERPDPSDAFNLMKFKNSLTKQDALTAISIIKQTMAEASKGSSTLGSQMVKDDLERAKLQSRNVINGYAYGPKDGIAEPYVQPKEIEEISGKYQETLAKIMPYVDFRMAFWLNNLANGRNGITGNDSIDIAAALARYPNISSEEAVTKTLAGQSKEKTRMMNQLSQQLKYQQNQPGLEGQQFAGQYQIAKNVASQFQSFKRNIIPMKRTISQRFGPLG